MKNRTILWIFLAFTLGFALPVCSCVGSGLLAMTAMGRMAGGATTPMVTGDAVAVIWLDGAITSGPLDYFTTTGITPGRTNDLLEQAAVNPNIKAVVLRVNSPGGSVVASDEIYHALLDFEKPVIIWMGEMAASGGYYISCGGDYVFAHPDTLTGSIGVISQFINAQDLMDEIGVDVVVITSGPRKDMGSLFREMTEDEQALWQEVTDEIYAGFVELVASARDLPLETVRELADGRVYTGRQAQELGLVDEVGTLDDAIAKAAEMGGIEGEPQVIELKHTPSFFDALYGLQARSAVPTLNEVLSWAGAPSVQYR
ncbi:MAG: signal peptide peptidase SppA [Chloroflexi bacterium]|nr:MAG: signal peptide peptidase SppA [Chloroflexota bacterium]HEY72569.1 signal peptide peptidase SppA [Thermoflexia bacterium]